jgi:hypothetical protein
MVSNSVEVDKLLSRIYFDPAHPGGFGGRERLYREALALEAKVKRPDIKRFLTAVDAYTIHRDLKRKFPRQATIAPEIDYQWQADLVVLPDLVNNNDGYMYILTVIDIFSKYAWAEPLKKKTGDEITAAFTKILNSSNRKPQKLQTDKGVEFLNTKFQAYLNTKGISFFTTNSDFKAAVVERFNRTLKSHMWRYFTKNNTRRYMEVLPSLMKAYNSSIHRSIGMPPSEVTLANQSLVYKKLYGTAKPTTGSSKPQYFVNQPVRLNILKMVFEKGYTGNWTEEIFFIDKIYRQYLPFMYRVRDSTGETVKGRFYEQELQPVTVTADKEYKIERIVKRRKRKGHPAEVLVKWQGYPDSANSWEPESAVQNL